MSRYYWLGSETERNGYHDSDFFAVCYDADEHKIVERAIGSTRYGGCSEHQSQCCYVCAGIDRECPPEIVALADDARYRQALLSARAHLAGRRHAGARVRLTAPARNKVHDLGPCQKCDGSGNWVNPSNAADVRSCFGCAGAGTRKLRTGKMLTIAVGTEGTIVDASERRSQYGTWSYGTTLTIRRDDGTEFRAPSTSVTGVYDDADAEQMARRNTGLSPSTHALLLAQAVA